MKIYCIHCGQPIEGEAPSPGKELNCPACGKATSMPASPESQNSSNGRAGGPAREPFRVKRRDLAIGASAFLLLVVLAFLFLRLEHSTARRLVFGDLASAPPPWTGSGVAPSSSSPGSAAGSGSYSPAQPSPGPSAGGGGVGGGGAGGGGSGVGVAPGGVSHGWPPASGHSANGSLQKQAESGPSTPPGTGAGAGTGAGGGSPGLGSSPGGGAGTVSAVGSGPQASAAGGSGLGAMSAGATVGGGAGGLAGNGTPMSRQVSGPAAAGASATPAAMPAATASASRPSTASVQPASPNAPNFATGQPNSDSASASSSNPSEAMPEQVAKESTAELLQVAKNDSQPGTAGAKTSGPDSQQKPAEPGAGQANAQQGQPVTDDSHQPSAPPADWSATSGVARSEGHSDGDPKAKDTEQKPDTSRPFEPQRGSNVVFVLDHSLSMHGEKSARARRELVDTLENLGTNKSFYVIFFPYQAMPAPGPLPATPENIQSMTNWIFSLGHSLGSDPTKAMERALELKPDTVWLLSDGKFSSKVPKAIRTANDSVNARVHTIGFYERTGEQVLRQIAEENGGTYRFVPPPDSSRPGNETSPVAAPK